MHKNIEDARQLALVNQQIVAADEVLPVVRLKDGSAVQTGTVAAMLHNITLYNAGQRCQAEAALLLAIPTLARIGLFDLFTPEEWINSANPGRRFVGERARDYLASRPGA